MRGRRWAEIRKHPLLAGRSAASLRNRYLRIEQHKAATAGLIPFINKCTKCGAPRVGHSCPLIDVVKNTVSKSKPNKDPASVGRPAAKTYTPLTTLVRLHTCACTRTAARTTHGRAPAPRPTPCPWALPPRTTTWICPSSAR